MVTFGERGMSGDTLRTRQDMFVDTGLSQTCKNRI